MHSTEADYSVPDTECVWHGDDRAGAIGRARRIKGRVVWSWRSTGPTRRDRGEWGYWSEPNDGAFLRTGESVVWDHVRGEYSEPTRVGGETH